MSKAYTSDTLFRACDAAMADWGCDAGRWDRRRVLAAFGAATVLGAATPLALAHAATPEDRRLLVVILRGALDGLAAVPPYTDPAYRAVRGALALPESAMIDLDGRFAMHAAFAPVAGLWRSGELRIMHAAATPYRERSHFDAQNVLESGGTAPRRLGTGWLNRALAVMPVQPDAVALGQTPPLMIQGPARVGSWSPSWLPEPDGDFLDRVEALYAGYPPLHGALTAARALATPEDPGQASGFARICAQAAAFMRAAGGPRVASIEIGGWDTHANQGAATGRLARLMGVLAEGLALYRRDMGEAWSKTAVLAVTEFGRTARPTGSAGTDHGSGAAAFLLSGRPAASAGLLGDWPGLHRLHEDRDLVPANDLRALIKAVLTEQLGLDEGVIEASVLPDSRGARLSGRLFA